ncbi:hypothetical protein GH714_035747 [Hevea brasiliensis]|uniref:Uncharacterized protein n=1 Tax=Hevea brasiliensis TaxID=3981 RepID=A0A6A6KTF9_HEVBR|nr:hypothetical protein GH714_035747 [Hevea brasiliensis]
MDEEEFRRLLDLFPVVRPRDYHIDLDPSRQSTTRPTQDDDVALETVAYTLLSLPSLAFDYEICIAGEEMAGRMGGAGGDQKKQAIKLLIYTMGAAEAKKFCNAFQQVHRRLVYEELSLDAARSIINSTRSSGEQLSS